MLVLSRRPDQSFLLGDDITITVLGVDGDRVKLGIQAPRSVVVLRHEPKNAVKGVVLGLVGKGITFDTGGISIKPADNMDKMKDDMSGGAAVLCAMAAMSRLNAPVRCIGVIPTTENVAIEVWRRLQPHLNTDSTRLHSIRLYETEDLFVDYAGDEKG